MDQQTTYRVQTFPGGHAYLSGLELVAYMVNSPNVKIVLRSGELTVNIPTAEQLDQLVHWLDGWVRANAEPPEMLELASQLQEFTPSIPYGMTQEQAVRFDLAQRFNPGTVTALARLADWVLNGKLAGDTPTE